MPAQSSTGVIVRIEPDGFGIVREDNTNRSGYFTHQSIKHIPGKMPIREGMPVSFEVGGAKGDLMNIVSVWPLNNSG
jgi:hypothetical protein